MNYFKKTVAILLSSVMVVGLVACGKTANNEEKPAENKVEKSALYQDTTRTIEIGSWYEQYYTSAHTDITDNPKVDNQEHAEMQLKNVRTVEQRYNVLFYYRNLLWDGVIEAINTTIMAGTPECDIFMVDLQFGIPAVLNDYAYSLEYILKESPEASKVDEKYLDVFADGGSEVVTTLQFTPDGKTYLFGQKAINTNAYGLGYNSDLITQYGLTDPYELYINENWTWAEWLKDMQAITQDTDGDGSTDQWGFRGPWTVLVQQLLMSNNASIAGVKPDDSGKVVEQVTSENTTEVLNFLSDMFQTYKLSFWDSDCDAAWNDNVYAWAAGNIGFWVDALWIAQEADADQNMIKNRCIVNWPVGPHGDAKTNASQNATTGTYFIIPVGIENPALIYCVMYDYWNWYGEDLTLRDDLEWATNWSYTDRNLEVYKSMGDGAEDFTTDLWQMVTFSDEAQIRGIIETGADATAITVSEFQQANKQIVQEYLDLNFNAN